MTVLFAIAIVLAAVSSLGVVLSRQTIYSALSLVLTVGMLAVLVPAAQRAIPLRSAADHLRGRGDGAVHLHRCAPESG